jgi:class 3 adenylate cyclase
MYRALENTIHLCAARRFQDLGEVLLKGFDRPIRVHAIQ